MANSDLKIRTKDYALSVIRLFAALPKRTETQILGRQLLRAGTSVGAQYREATRGKSTADFISKIEGSPVSSFILLPLSFLSTRPGHGYLLLSALSFDHSCLS
jgi:23S rRNA-intervening sequence protein